MGSHREDLYKHRAKLMSRIVPGTQAMREHRTNLPTSHLHPPTILQDLLFFPFLSKSPCPWLSHPVVPKKWCCFFKPLVGLPDFLWHLGWASLGIWPTSGCDKEQLSSWNMPRTKHTYLIGALLKLTFHIIWASPKHQVEKAKLVYYKLPWGLDGPRMYHTCTKASSACWARA